MGTIIGSSVRDCVLIILFQCYCSKAGLFENNLFWVGQCDHPPPNLSKIIPCQKTPDITL